MVPCSNNFLFFGITVSFVPDTKPIDQMVDWRQFYASLKEGLPAVYVSSYYFFIFYDCIYMSFNVAVGVAEGLRAVSGELPLGFDMHCSPMFIRSLAALGIMAPLRLL